MEVTLGRVHTSFPIDDPSRIGQARRFAAELCNDFGWTEVDAGRLGLVVTELGTNLLRHASKGRLLLAARAEHREVEVISIDEGPGIADVALSMRDGHSSGGSPGTGLGALKRLSSDFEIYSTVPGGTVCVARVRPVLRASPDRHIVAQGRFDVRAVCLPAPGERVSGDGWASAAKEHQITVLLADGLGHGPEAEKAANAALHAFSQAPTAGLRATVERVHGELQTTRGAAVLALQVDGDAEVVRYTGAGNVMARVISGIYDRALVTQHGTAGMQIRKLEEAVSPLPPHAIVVLHSDGLASRWDPNVLRPLLGRDLTLLAALLLRDHSRGRDDATVVVIRRRDS